MAGDARSASAVTVAGSLRRRSFPHRFQRRHAGRYPRSAAKVTQKIFASLTSFRRAEHALMPHAFPAHDPDSELLTDRRHQPPAPPVLASARATSTSWRSTRSSHQPSSVHARTVGPIDLCPDARAAPEPIHNGEFAHLVDSAAGVLTIGAILLQFGTLRPSLVAASISRTAHRAHRHSHNRSAKKIFAHLARQRLPTFPSSCLDQAGWAVFHIKGRAPS